MGKAKRFNSYDETVNAQRAKVKGFGQERQNLAGIGSSFRSPALQPPISNKLRGTGTGDGKFLTVSLSADQTGNIAVNNHVEFDTKDEDGGIVLQTGAGQLDGIFELLGGRKYYLQASLRPEFSGSTGQLEVAWFDQTNSAEIGSRAKYEAQDHSGSDANQPTAAAIVTPSTNILVKLEILSVTALDALANEYCHANLFEIALGGFTSGGGGGGGGTLTFPITPTIKDESDTWTSPVTIDLSLTTAHITKFTLDTNLTLVFSNPPASGTQIEFEIEFVQDATGGRTVTFPASVVEVVSIATGPSAQTIVTCRTNDGGTTFNVIPALRGSISLSGNFANIELDNLANVAINTSLISDTDDTDSLGSASKEWKDLFIDGTANIDTLAATTMSGNLAMGNNNISGVNLITASNVTVTATFNANGTVNLGDAVTDSINFLGRANTDLVPISVSAHDLGASGLQWDALWVNRIESATTVTGSPFNINSAVITLGDAITDSIAFLGRLSSNAVIPLAGNTTDLGASTLEFADAYINRVASTVTFTGATTNINSTTINLGDAITDTINFLGRLGSSAVIPIADNATDLGTTILEFKDIFVDGTANIDTINLGTSGVIEFSTTTQNITSDGGGLIIKVPTDDDFDFQINSISKMFLNATQLDLQANNIVDCGNITPSATDTDDLGTASLVWRRVFFETLRTDTLGESITADANGFLHQVLVADRISMTVGNDEQISIQDGISLFGGVIRLKDFSDATRPTAATAGAGGIIWSSTDTVPIYSDGTNWRLFSDNSIT